MNKVVRMVCLSLACAVIAVLAACAHKPAYSGMEGSGDSRNQNKNQSVEDPANASVPAATEPAPAAEASQPVGAGRPARRPGRV